MSRIAIICAAVLVACAKSETEPAADTAAAAPTATPATISLADVAGTWNIRAMDPDGSNIVESKLVATADTSGWTQTRPGQAPTPVRILAVDGDSIVTESGPFPSTLRRGLQVRSRTVYRLQGDKLVGTIEKPLRNCQGRLGRSASLGGHARTVVQSHLRLPDRADLKVRSSSLTRRNTAENRALPNTGSKWSVLSARHVGRGSTASVARSSAC